MFESTCCGFGLWRNQLTEIQVSVLKWEEGIDGDICSQANVHLPSFLPFEMEEMPPSTDDLLASKKKLLHISSQTSRELRNLKMQCLSAEYIEGVYTVFQASDPKPGL